MALPITVPYVFGNATTAQNLSYLDSNFSQLANTINGIGNGTVALANVTITGGTIASNSSPFIAGNATPVAASQMGIQYQAVDGQYQPKSEGGIWSGNVSTYMAISKEFNSVVTSGDSPQITLFVEGNNNNTTTGPVVSIIADAICRTNNTGVFASNFIARSDVVSNVKLVGCEIDVEASIGATVSSASGGMFINAFTFDGCGPGIQFGGIDGGKFNNGIVVNAVSSTGAAFADQAGLSCKYGLALSNGTYSDSAIFLKLNNKIKFSTAADLYGDSGNYLTFKLNSGALFDSGTSAENNLISAWRDSSATSSLQVFTASGFSWNGAATAMTVAKNTVTNRSINAAGTINASGADYAEYETKNETCSTIQKGQIVGFDTNGLITDKWNEAISFAVKSTNPTIVGGDQWHESIGLAPVEPEYIEPNIAKPEYPTQSIKSQNNKTIEEFNEEWAEYKAVLESAKKSWEDTVYKKYLSELAAYNAKLEIERQKVDRIAYCGKVPVNVYGASVGDYIVPINKDGAINGIAVSNPTFEQYKISVGRVRKVLSDGRAEIVVKSI